MMFATRFAPSPTGRLHLGHAFSALTGWQTARAQGGRFILRIEDIDPGRCRPEFETGILEDLEWLGLDWEEPVRRQSDHLADYQAHLSHLQRLGVVYRCFRTRKEIVDAAASAPQAIDGASPGVYFGPTSPMSSDEEAERLASGAPFAWRLSVSCSQDALGEDFARLRFIEQGDGPNGEHGEITARPELCGDVILARKETPSSYHLSVVSDDCAQDISHVIRGVDLFESTHVQVLIQALLRLPNPVYRHHRLIIGPDGRRLAKRDRSVTLQSLRESGVTPTDIRRQLGLQT